MKLKINILVIIFLLSIGSSFAQTGRDFDPDKAKKEEAKKEEAKKKKKAKKEEENQPATSENNTQPARQRQELNFSKTAPNFETTSVPTTVRVKIPKEFQKMTEQQLAKKYDAADPPLQAYTDVNQAVDIFVTEARNNFPIQDLALLHDFFHGSLELLYDDIEWVQEEMVTVGGRDFMKVAFIGLQKAPENHIYKRTNKRSYYIIYYTLKDNKRINVSFSFPTNEKGQWLSIGEKMMKTIRL